MAVGCVIELAARVASRELKVRPGPRRGWESRGSGARGEAEGEALFNRSAPGRVAGGGPGARPRRCGSPGGASQPSPGASLLSICWSGAGGYRAGGYSPT